MDDIKQSLISVATIKFEENTLTYSRWLDDNELLLRLGNSDFVAKEKMYHGVCRINCHNKAGRTEMTMKEKLEKKLKETLQKRRKIILNDIHRKFFEGVCGYIEDIIVNSKEV